MNTDIFQAVSLKRADIDRAIASMSVTAPHWVPVLRAVRDHGIGTVSVLPTKSSFWPLPAEYPASKPVLVYLGDDLDASRGPAAFHTRSLKRLFRDCCGVVTVACCAHTRSCTRWRQCGWSCTAGTWC